MMPGAVEILVGDALEVMRGLPAERFQTCVTSPPYFGLRDYGVAGQIGLEETPDAYVARLVEVFREVRRLLRDDGTLWLNIGDTYAMTTRGRGGLSLSKAFHGTAERGGKGVPGQRLADRRAVIPSGCKPKDLLMIPAMVALALRADGWWLRSEIVWHKPNPMPESIRDRPTQAHEKVFLLTKSARYYYDADAIAEPFETDPKERYEQRARITGRGDQGFAGSRGNDRDRSGGFPAPSSGMRNARNVWRIATRPSGVAHFATMPPDLVERCVKAGSRPGDAVLDPFFGAGTTGAVAQRLGRSCTGIELNADYAEIARARVAALNTDAPSDPPPLLAAMAAE